MKIDLEKCIGCGNCVKDCVSELLEVHNGTVNIKNGYCIECGHCVAICPTGAARLPQYPTDDILEYDPLTFGISSEILMNFMKFRRSVRQFAISQEVEQEKIYKIIEAGRYAPTAANQQKKRYIVLKAQRENVARIAVEVLYQAALCMGEDDQLKSVRQYKDKWINMYQNFTEKGEDQLFYHAPCVILTVSSARNNTGDLDAGLASAYMELMANALGLGVCYVGFFAWAVEFEPTLREMLGLKASERLISTMAVGYPSAKYLRTVGRKEALITDL